MKKGDKVRIIAVPPGLVEDSELGTLAVFQQCIGKEFEIQEITESGFLELEMSSVTRGKRPEWIWIEPEYVQLLE